MIASLEQAERQFILSGISWETYETLLREIEEPRVRITYDDGELEFMTLSFGHENAAEWIGRLIFCLALELSVPICSGGSTTLKQNLRRKGLESDGCFWINQETAMRGKKSWDALIDPPPDLAVEIDISSSSLNRLAIYAALQVPEIWHFDGEDFKVLILDKKGKYQSKKRSRAFPWLPIKEFSDFVFRLGTEEEISLYREFSEWVRVNVAPKKK